MVLWGGAFKGAWAQFVVSFPALPAPRLSVSPPHPRKRRGHEAAEGAGEGWEGQGAVRPVYAAKEEFAARGLGRQARPWAQSPAAV
jgi:hypothetical protein